MGSHSKKRKKDRRRSRSHSSERHRHRSRSRSKSKSPTYRSSKHKKHHKRSRSRSRSRSRERHSHSRKSSRSRSRSRERSREKLSRRRRSRSSSLSKRSRSRSAERKRRRSRSTERSRSKRSRSRERQKSPRSPERSSARSSRGGSQDSKKVKNEKDKDVEDSTDTHLNPAEAIHQKMRKALEAAASADAKLREQGLLSSARQELLTPTEQLERDQKLQNIESESFTQSTFVPSRDRQVTQPMSYLTQEQTHDNAIFGGVGVPNPALNGGTQMYSYGIPMTYKKKGQLASKYLSESIEEKEKRWLEKLQAMRRQKLEANPDYFNKLLTINADSPSRE